MARVGGCAVASCLAEVCVESQRLNLLLRWQHVLFPYKALTLTGCKPEAKQTDTVRCQVSRSLALSFFSLTHSYKLSEQTQNKSKHASNLMYIWMHIYILCILCLLCIFFFLSLLLSLLFSLSCLHLRLLLYPANFQQDGCYVRGVLRTQPFNGCTNKNQTVL